MKKKILAILLTILTVGIITSAITCTYVFKLNEIALWVSLIVISFIQQVIFSLLIFYGQHRHDETKAFWLFIILITPFIGWIWFLLFGLKTNKEFLKSDNNHAKLLNSLFGAKKSIKIYCDKFYPTYDTFNALAYARWKKLDVTVLIKTNSKKSWQKHQEYILNKNLPLPIKVNFSDKEITNSFAIIDDEYVIKCDSNFNFKNIYSCKLEISNDVSFYKDLYELTLLRSTERIINVEKVSLRKRLKVAIKNIFYPFF